MLGEGKKHVTYIALLAIWAAGLALSASGCDDASLRIRFDVPDDYEGLADTFVLHVLVPPNDPGVSFDCDGLAFGQVSQDTLRASQVQEVQADSGGIDLSGIPRVDDKLLWIEALRQGETIVAGCAPLGEITDSETVTINGEPTKVVGFLGNLESLPNIGEPLPRSVLVTVTDADGISLQNQRVEWRIIGFGGVELSDGAEQTSDRGTVTLNLGDTSSIAGPALLDVRARWERTPLAPLGGYGSLDGLGAGNLPGTPPPASSNQTPLRSENLYAVGRIGPAGEMGFVALGPSLDPEVIGRPLVAVYYDTNAEMFQVGVAAQPVRSERVAVAPIVRDGRDVAMIAVGDELLEVSVTAGGVSTVPHATVAGAPVAMVPSGSCDDPSEELLLLVETSTGVFSLAALDGQGVEVTSPFVTAAPNNPVNLLNSGCVSGLTEGATRTVVYSVRGAGGPGDNGNRQQIVADTGVARSTLWINFAPSAGFTPALGNEVAGLLGVELDIQGTSLVRNRLAPLASSALELQRLDEDDLFTFARSMQGGDFDNDGLVDLAALMDFGAVTQQDRRRRYRLQLVLGAEHRGRRIIGVSEEQSFEDPHLVVADFNGDEADDILIADRTRFLVVQGEPTR